MVKILSYENHEIKTALRLKEGVRLAQSGHFDIVFLDVCMPDGNGIDEITTIRQTASRPEVVVITASANIDGAETAITSGAYDYIEKPASVKELLTSSSRFCSIEKRPAARTRPQASSGIGSSGGASRSAAAST